MIKKVLFLIIASTIFLSPANAQQGGVNSRWNVFTRAGGPSTNLQCYDPANVTVSGGYLNILTKPQTETCVSFDLPSASYNYTSGQFMMRSFNFLYGHIQFRMKFGPCNGSSCNSSGSWPALWMLDSSCQASDPTGTDNSCNGQEIDIAEVLNGDFTHINEQIHTPNFGGHNDGCTAAVSDASLNFHTYALDWASGSLVFSIDGTTTCTITQTYIPNATMYIKFDAAITGTGGSGGTFNSATLPWTQTIDYLSVTQTGSLVFFDSFGNQRLRKYHIQ